jgi:hypothetical protein
VNPPSDDVIRRVDRIVKELVADVSRSIISRSMLEASNRVLQALAGIRTSGAEGHKIIQASLRMGLCLELARVFDVGRRPIPKQDKASLPILAYYLVQPDVRQRLVARSGPYANLCEAEIDACLARWTAFNANSSDAAALDRMQQLRDWRIAHNIFEKEPELPTHRGIFRLVSVAASITCHAQGAITPGRKIDFKTMARSYRRSGNDFWARFVKGAKAEFEREGCDPKPPGAAVRTNRS